MVDDAPQRVQTNRAFSKFLMSVFMAPHRIHTVVQMNSTQPGKADDLIEGIQNFVQPVNQIVPAVGDMAGVKTHSHFIR